MRHFIVILLQVSISAFIHAQEAPVTYPDSVLPGSDPEIFGEGTISSDNLRETSICFSQDGKEIFFTRAKDTTAQHYEIFLMRRQNGKWSLPARAPFSGKDSDYDPFLSPDGDRIWFISERRKPDILSYIGEIWYSERKGGKWEKPVYPQTILNESWIACPVEVPGGRLFFSSFRNRKIGIYYADNEDKSFTDPVFLPEEVNGIPGASQAFADPAQNYILFTAHPLGHGKTFLYISLKDEAGNWTDSVPLNEKINLTGTECYPRVSPDGKYLFFSREGDIYWVELNAAILY